MASTLQVLFDGTPAGEDFYTTYASLEVEENADLPGAFQLLFPVSRSADGDLTGVADARFKPLANLAVVATPEGKADECIFDGHRRDQRHAHRLGAGRLLADEPQREGPRVGGHDRLGGRRGDLR